MSSVSTEHEKISPTTAREILTQRIKEAQLELQRCTKVHDGSGKACYDHDELFTPREVPSKKYGVKGLDELVVVDVDNWDAVPDELRQTIENNSTFSVRSPHSEGKEGHYYYRCVDQASEARFDGGDIKTGAGYVLGPGSKLETCDKTDHDCSEPSEGFYEIKADRSIAEIRASDLPSGSTGGERDIVVETGDSPSISEAAVDDAKEYMEKLQRDYPTAYKCLMDRLRGGTGLLEGNVTREDGTIDRSAVDLVTLSHLYGVMREIGREDEDQAKRLTHAIYSHYAKECPRVNDVTERRKKWLCRGDKYRATQIHHAHDAFDSGKFYRWANKTSSRGYRRDGVYSSTTRMVTLFAVVVLSDPQTCLTDVSSPEFEAYLARRHDLDLDSEAIAEAIETVDQDAPMYKDTTPRTRSAGYVSRCDYPRKEDVVKFARKLDDGYNAKATYEEALRRLRRDGCVKLACLKEGVDYRYYESFASDPEEAEYIKTEGEKQYPKDN